MKPSGDGEALVRRGGFTRPKFGAFPTDSASVRTHRSWQKTRRQKRDTEDAMQAVRDIMTTDVVRLDPEMTLREAAVVFADRHVTGAPVVANGRVMGVLSASDILEAEASIASDTGDAGITTIDGFEDEGGSTAAFFARLWPDAAVDVNERFRADRRGDSVTAGSPLDALMVADAMSRSILDVRPEATITHAAERMATASVHRLLVVDDDGLVGIITTSDIARWLAGRLRPAR
jgi:CBS domain-containing protein